MISAAMKTSYASNINFLKMREITEKTKIDVYKTIFCSILTHGCESWVLTNDIRSRIQAAEMKYLRGIKGITRRDVVRNEVMRQQLKVESILKKIHKQQLEWFGHLMRMNNSRPVKKVWQTRTTEKGKKGLRAKHGKIQQRT